jgi:hypothetical protein
LAPGGLAVFSLGIIGKLDLSFLIRDLSGSSYQKMQGCLSHANAIAAVEHARLARLQANQVVNYRAVN